MKIIIAVTAIACWCLGFIAATFAMPRRIEVRREIQYLDRHITNTVVTTEYREIMRSMDRPTTNHLGMVSWRVMDAYLISSWAGKSFSLNGRAQSNEVYLTPNSPLMFDRLAVWAYPVGPVIFKIEPSILRRYYWETNGSGSVIIATNEQFGWVRPVTRPVSNYWGGVKLKISNWDEWRLTETNHITPYMDKELTNYHVIPLPEYH